MPLFWRKMLAVSIFTVVCLLFFRILGQIVGGVFAEAWLDFACMICSFFGLMISFLRGFIFQNTAPQPAMYQLSLSSWDDGSTKANGIILEGFNKMQENTKVFIQNPTIFNVNSNNSVTNNTVHSGIIGSGTVNIHHYNYATEHLPSNLQPNTEINSQRNDLELKPSESKSRQKITGSKSPNKKMMKAVRKILENYPDGLSAAAIFSHLQRQKLNTPDGIADDSDIRSYISKIAGALREQMAIEGLTITSRPYKIAPLQTEEESFKKVN